MPTGSAHWKVGVMTVPGSTGSQSVTGLGGTPAAVFFYGTNWLTEDAVVTSTGTGLFRGMAAPKYDAPSTTLQFSSSVIPAGDAMYFREDAIGMIDSSLGFVYRATLTSFDADGFSVTWQSVTAGGYKVVYVALMDVSNVGAFRGTTNQAGLAFGFKAGASLYQGVYGTGDSGGNVANNSQTQNWYGGGAYPGASASGWMSAAMVSATFPASASQQYVTDLTLDLPHIRAATGVHFSGPFLITSDITAAPSGTNLSFAGEIQDSGMIVAWDDEDSATGGLTPGAATGNTQTVSGLPFRPGLVIGYAMSDEPHAQGTGGRGAAGFSVVSTGFQWTALVDGVDRGAFQSFQRGVVDVVHNSNVHAATVELTEDGFVVTTEEDDVSPASWAWHAFGHPQPLIAWLPSIYRRVFGTSLTPPEAIAVVIAKSAPETTLGASGSGTSYLFTGFVLLESTDQIILEDGSGFLLL